MKLRVLSRATRDLEKIQAYIEVDDPNSAARVGLAIVKAMELIRQNPNVGRPTAGRPTREWSIPGLPYLIPYRVKDEYVEVLRVFHTRRKRPTEWR